MSNALDIANACVPSAESELPIMPHARAILVGVARDRIQAALDEARRKAIEDAAKVADKHSIQNDISTRCDSIWLGRMRAAQNIADDIRALLSESKS